MTNPTATTTTTIRTIATTIATTTGTTTKKAGSPPPPTAYPSSSPTPREQFRRSSDLYVVVSLCPTANQWAGKTTPTGGLSTASPNSVSPSFSLAEQYNNQQAGVELP